MNPSLKQNDYFKSMLLLVLFISVLARIPALLERGVGRNESVTLLTVAGQSLPELPVETERVGRLREKLFGKTAPFAKIASDLKIADVHPPLYFWSLAIWSEVFGHSLLAARAFSALCFLAFAALIARIFAGRLRTVPLGLFVLAASCSSCTFFYSIEARSYMFCLMLILASAAMALHSVREPILWRRFLGILLAGFFSGLGVYTIYLMLFPALAIAIWCMGRARPRRQAILDALFFAVPLLFFGGLDMSYYFAQVNSRPDQVPGYNGVASDLLFYLTCLPHAISNLSIAWIQISLAALLMFLSYFFIRARRREGDLWLMATLLAVLPIAGLMFMNLFLNKHLYPFRYFTFVSGGLWLGIGLALAELSQRLGPALATLALGLILAVEAFSINPGRPTYRADYSKAAYRRVARALAAQAKASTLVLIEHTSERDWYAGFTEELDRQNPGLPVQIVPAEDTAIKLLRASPYSDIWYLIDQELSGAKREAFEAALAADKRFSIVERAAWGYRVQVHSMLRSSAGA